jgi:ferredoxin
MKIRIEADKCQGHGMCALSCPEIFHLSDEDGHAYVLDENVPMTLEGDADRAARSCPERAIQTF